MVIKLMDPKNWLDCPILGCRKSKDEGYLTCSEHKNICPDGDCQGTGKKTTRQEMCDECCQYFQKKLGFEKKSRFYVYLLDNTYVGMTSNPQQRIQKHQEYRKSKRQKGDNRRATVVWWSPVFGDWKQALRCEWALDCMLDEAIVYKRKTYIDLFKRITNIRASEAAIKKASEKSFP